MAIIVVLSALSLLGAANASAATETGNKCAANKSTGPFMFVSLANGSGNPLPATIPSAGVITRWSFSIGLPIPPEANLFETLKVFRPAGPQLLVVGESATERASGGTQTFSTRIPVQAGDLIGALASVPPSTGTVFCETGNPGDRVGVINGTAPAGSTVTITEEAPGLQNPVVVFVEPDADNDGYGDETQDACPQNAALQTPCPVVALSTSATVKKGLATFLVTSSIQASVKATGTVNLGKGKKVKLSGGTQIVVPGTLSKFTLLFPQKLKAKLEQLSPKQFLWLKLTATAPNIVGGPTVSKKKVKLKGQAKPKPRRQAKA
ncbi:MAG TPA: hypothetical protein VIV13_00905 [Solirubrobacterales bacterium]